MTVVLLKCIQVKPKSVKVCVCMQPQTNARGLNHVAIIQKSKMMPYREIRVGFVQLLLNYENDFNFNFLN